MNNILGPTKTRTTWRMGQFFKSTGGNSFSIVINQVNNPFSRIQVGFAINEPLDTSFLN